MAPEALPKTLARRMARGVAPLKLHNIEFDCPFVRTLYDILFVLLGGLLASRRQGAPTPPGLLYTLLGALPLQLPAPMRVNSLLSL